MRPLCQIGPLSRPVEKVVEISTHRDVGQSSWVMPPCLKQQTVWSTPSKVEVLSSQNRSDARTSCVGGHRPRRPRGRRRGPAGFLQALLRYEEQRHGVHGVCAVQRPPDALQTTRLQVQYLRSGVLVAMRVARQSPRMLANQRTSIFEYGGHHAQASSPQRARLTSMQKEYCRELSGERVRPMRIHHALSRKFELPLEELPDLTCVQNYVNNYARTSLDSHDLFDELSAWTVDRGFTGSEPETQPFAFTWALDPLGKPVIGDGTDESPFIVGLTTNTLIKRLLMPPESFVLHIDATYKLNTLDYPVLVIGVSDRARHFHLVAMFVVSQQVEPVFDAVLLSLRRLFGWVTGRELVVRYAMGDADQAQYNALFNAFGRNPQFQFLMCFFHVMENVEKHMKSLTSHESASVVHDIYDLHFAPDVETFSAMRDEIIQRWWSKPQLMRFAQYMCGQWLYGRFCNWQAFWTGCGYASTNNPVETFNQVIKRDYTLRRRLKMGTLLNELSSCCRHQSSSRQGFISFPAASASLVRRASELVREKLLQQWGEVQTTTTAQGPQVVVHVLAAAPKRINITPTRRSKEGIAASAQMGANYARMEVQGQPKTGWPVNLTMRWCPCKYWFKFGICVHLLLALRLTERVNCDGRRVLVSRRKKRGASNTVEANNMLAGRPQLVGPALTF